MVSKENLKSVCEDLLHNSKTSWQKKHQHVFSYDFTEIVVKSLGKLPDYQYQNPNLSYEEDVKAFLNTILKEIEIDTAAKQAESLVLSDSSPGADEEGAMVTMTVPFDNLYVRNNTVTLNLKVSDLEKAIENLEEHE